MIFVYENSDHDDTPVQSPRPGHAPRAPQRSGDFAYANTDHSPPAVNSLPPAVDADTFTYDRTDVEPPKGTPDSVVPAEIRALRENDEDRRMYSAQTTYREVIKDDAADTPEFRAVRAEGREIFADLGLADHEGREFVQLLDTELAAGIPDDATIAAWGAEATQDTFRRYGKDAEARLADARLLVRRDARVRNILNQTGLGSHPKVVRLLIEKATSERMRGRLK